MKLMKFLSVILALVAVVATENITAMNRRSPSPDQNKRDRSLSPDQRRPAPRTRRSPSPTGVTYVPAPRPVTYVTTPTYVPAPRPVAYVPAPRPVTYIPAPVTYVPALPRRTVSVVHRIVGAIIPLSQTMRAMQNTSFIVSTALYTTALIGNVNGLDATGVSALHRAVAERSIIQVQALLIHGADINIQSSPRTQNITVLQVAIFNNDLPMVNFLLSQGAQIDERDIALATQLGRTRLFIRFTTGI